MIHENIEHARGIDVGDDNPFLALEERARVEHEERVATMGPESGWPVEDDDYFDQTLLAEFLSKRWAPPAAKAIVADIPPSALDAALHYISLGLPVFPIWGVIQSADGNKMVCRCGAFGCDRDKGKHPFTRLAPRGHNSATADRATVEKWFTNYPDSNIGIRMVGDVIAVDVDTRHDGHLSLQALEEQHGALPVTWRARTGGGGEHIFFGGWPEGVAIKPKLTTGIELKGTGTGYVVAAPSLHASGKRYEWTVKPGDVPLAPIPHWLLELARRDDAAAPNSTVGSSSDDNPFTALGNREKTAPIAQVRRALAAIPNNDDVDWAAWNKIGMATWAATNGSNDGLDAFMTWSGKHPSNNDLATKRRWGKISQCPPTDIGAAYLFRLAKESDPSWNDGPPGSEAQQAPHLTLVSVADNVVALPGTDTAGGSNYIDRLNRDHAVVLMEGQVLILHEQDGKPHFIAPADFHLWYNNDRIEIDDKKIPVSKLWAMSPYRRQYSRVVFDPRNTDPKCFNMWCGFSVKPDPTKSCKKFLAHIRDNICAGDDKNYLWLQAFLAHMVQKPEEKPGVAPVLRGEEGVGKGYFANVIGRLFEHHYVVLSQSTQLTGRFNSHFQRALLVFVDEGFWAGDKTGAGALYNLVTEPWLTIEGKHRDAFMVRSLLRLIMASNEKWVVPAGVGARRWGVLDVANTHANDRAYFAEIDAELQDGGLAALMHHLMTFDLSSVDVYSTPKTKALLEQKDETLPPHAQWWVETLTRGSFRYESEDRDRRGQVDEMIDWPDVISKHLIWEAYRLWMKQHNIRSRLLATQVLHRWFGKHKLLQGAKTTRSGSSPREVHLPALQECREAFDAYVGQPRDWADEQGGDFRLAPLAPVPWGGWSKESSDGMGVTPITPITPILLIKRYRTTNRNKNVGGVPGPARQKNLGKKVRKVADSLEHWS